MRWTEEQVAAYQAKRQAMNPGTVGAPDEGPESKMQSKIKKECENRGWLCLSFPRTPAVRRFLPAGWPDMSILVPLRKKWYFLELKSGKGRRSKEQVQMALRFMSGGHPIHEVRSFVQFIKIMEE